MSDSPHSRDPRIEEQDGAVSNVDDPDAQQDTVSGGAPEQPDSSEEAGRATELPEDAES